MSLKHLEKSLYEAPIVKKGEYDYVIHPITDGVPFITPELLKEVTDEMKKHIKKCGTFDRIVTMEAMGIPLATSLSLDLGIPFTIIRKRQYGLPGEVSVEQVTGYSKSKMYINGLKKGDTVILVDDVLSTGGTLKAVLYVLKEIGVVVKGVFIAVYKGTCKEEITKTYGIPITTIVDIEVINGEVTIK
ncbi:MAG TPA: hypoxanthine/guanine phosphoribosyltransferase [Candidatus Thermoplasmatota archaeon]|jgi:adenine phosphoribosyltransferase|nr:hypoxanthine/guanine phosphoribosyltransferase [Candidatus Thermoplasmatota archaeon]